MKIILLAVYQVAADDSKKLETWRLGFSCDGSSVNYFLRTTLQEHLLFVTRTIVQRTPFGSRQTVETKEQLDLVCHCYVNADGLAACLVTDGEYPSQSAHLVLSKALQLWNAKNKASCTAVNVESGAPDVELTRLMKEAENPVNVDKLFKIEKTLEEIKDIMHHNIEEVLQRGETLNSLMDKSKDLSDHSRAFYKKARAQNRCCKVW